MNIKFKKLHKDAVLPSYAKPGDAGLDLTATDDGVIHITKNGEQHAKYREYGIGISVEIPEGYVGLIFPRSSISNTGFMLSNAVGVIDSGYRGEIKFRFKLVDVPPIMYHKGDKIGQLVIMPYPKIEAHWVEELSQSERGDKGFGSSGK